jgi:AraC-like DNA-binding protein
LINIIANIIAIITVSQLILFALFLIGGKRDHGLDKTVLALFLLANGFFILNFLAFEYSGDIIPYTVNLFFIGGTFGFLFGPLLYLYTKAVNSRDFKLTEIDILHFVPFLVAFILTLVRFQFQNYETKIELLHTGLYGATGSVIYLSLMHITILVYLLKTFLLVKQKNQSLKGYYSSLEKINYDWLKLVVSAFFIMWIVDIINWITGSLGILSLSFQELLSFISLFINFLFANLLILKSLRLPETEPVAEIHKYEKSPLTLQTKSDILARLEKLMLQEKLFLNSSLNLGEVARKLSVVPRYLSQVINELKKQNFYDYVNGYRIEEAKKILSDPAHDSEKILSVLYDCGFNSKSVFNTVFKKYTGITPSEYRRKYKRSA